MKKILSILALCLAFVAGVSCQQLNDLESRMDSAESQISNLNSQLAAIQKAMADNVTVTKVETTATGYVIYFSNGTTATITNGKDGANGKDGVDGANGKDGVDGKDGKDGKDGDTLFADVTVGDSTVTITLTDGRAFTLPLASGAGAVSQISKLVYVPECSDLKATFSYYDENDAQPLKLRFDVVPASAAKALFDEADKAVYTVKAVEVATRAGSSVVLPSVVTFDDASLVVEVNAKSMIKDGAASDFAVCFEIEQGSDAVASDYVPVFSECTALDYAGVKYHTVKMADGRTWMAENLRFVPEGKTVSTDKSAIANGVWGPIDLNAKTIINDEAKIKEVGLLYNAEAAFGVEPGTINETNYATFEGCQGICPDGWHIPTGAEFFKLAGRMASWPGSPTAQSADKSSPSPYYNGDATTLGNCMMDLLNADGFNLAMVGTITVTTAAAATGTVVNTMSYVLGSTAYTGYTSLVKEGVFNNAQYFALMPMKSNGSANGATYNYRSAAIVRCIKNN